MCEQNINTSIPQASGKKYTFSFAWMTANKHYSLARIEKFRGNAAPILESLFELLTLLSKKSPDDLASEDKFHGGFEALPISAMKSSIIDQVPEDLQKSIEALSVIRFDKEKYRMIVLPSVQDPSLLYVLGFDMDYTLYNHGS